MTNPESTSAFAIVGAIQRKMCERGVVIAGRGIILVNSNEDMDGITRIIKSLQHSEYQLIELVGR